MNETCNRNKRILLVDDHSIVRDGVKQVLKRVKNLRFENACTTADEAIAYLEKNNIDLAIIDITLKGEKSGIELVKMIKEKYPEIKILVMSMHDENIYGERAIKAGALGYLMKDVASKNLINAINSVLNDELYISEDLKKNILNRVIKSSPSKSILPVNLLSNREFEIFQLFGQGYAIKEIAEDLDISYNTVESYKNRIKEKLQIKSTPELIKHSIQWVISQK